MTNILSPLLAWYEQNKRELPWRNTENPYLIWMSEVILQQTRVEQGLPYYQRFTERYPTVADLAAAHDDEVMKLWQGLGYYNRAANMLRTARLVMSDFNGVFPTTYEGLLTLKGIGPYTAAAIASFAYHEPHAVVDGNVYRVLSRVFGIDEPINSTSGKKLFANLAQELLNIKHPATHNQAMMELGATVCKPRQALCNTCVLAAVCEARRQNKVYDLPVKEKKRKPVDRYLNYIVTDDGKGYTYLRQRIDEGIWNKLYEFPVIETEAVPTAAALLKHEQMKERFSVVPEQLEVTFTAKHQLTHQTIYAVFWKAGGKQTLPKAEQGFIRIAFNKVHDFAVPRLLERFINTILPKR